LKSKDFNTIFNNTTSTANFLQYLEMLLPGIHLNKVKSVSLNLGMANPNPTTFLGNV